MAMDYTVLKEIISLAEAYQQQTQAHRWQKEQFVSWIINEANKSQKGPDAFIPSQNGLISMFLGIAYKYAQFYARRVFRNTEIYSLDDFAVTFFVTGNGYSTLAVEIYSRARQGVSLSINALSTLIFLFTVVLVIGYYYIERRNQRPANGKGGAV